MTAPKAPADVSGLVERLRNADVVDYPNTTQDLCDEAADALAARDAEIELWKGVAEKAMDAAMANARDEYRALYSTTIASLKQEIANLKDAMASNERGE